MFESKAGVLWIGGLGFFLFAFVSNALVPIFMYQDMPERTAKQMVNANLKYSFEDLQRRYPEQVQQYFGAAPAAPDDYEKWVNDSCEKALYIGRKVYVGEACWHCHSQFVRPVANESQRFGPVARTEEYQNELQRPVLFGTRRVGPDLSREGGRRSNDWHAVHFHKPVSVSTGSPMPEYPWFFDAETDEKGNIIDPHSPKKPNERGLAIILYVQWLGSWLQQYPTYEAYNPDNDPAGKKELVGAILPDVPAPTPKPNADAKPADNAAPSDSTPPKPAQ
jgi:cytochrome c oxidase cbb3-type subunit 2